MQKKKEKKREIEAKMGRRKKGTWRKLGVREVALRRNEGEVLELDLAERGRR